MSFLVNLLNWYYKNKRELPWRNIQDPYKIWLSEIMLQQTRIQQVYDYYNRFISLWGSVKELADASEEQILKAWEGLGYYSRARNLHQTAKIIAFEFNGIFPSSYQDLKKLPGIGAYTSRAIASFAFHQKVVALDGNGFRVITRIFDIDLPIDQSQNQKYIQYLADNLLENHSSKDFNYALMDLGSMICKPQNPLCEICPVQENCLAYKNNTYQERPVKEKNLKRTSDFLLFYFHQKNEQIAISKRKNSYWKGLFTFPYKLIPEKDWQAINQNIILELKHMLTHKDLYIKLTVNDSYDVQEEDIIWVNKSELKIKPFPRPFHSFIKNLQ